MTKKGGRDRQKSGSGDRNALVEEPARPRPGDDDGQHEKKERSCSRAREVGYIAPATVENLVPALPDRPLRGEREAADPQADPCSDARQRWILQLKRVPAGPGDLE